MGNRAVITTAPYDEKNVGVYLHWNGGPESVLAFAGAAKELGYRSPDQDPAYGLARLCALIALYFDITTDTSVGVGRCDELDTDGDNGVFLIGPDWEVVGQFWPSEGKKPKKVGKSPEPAKTHAIHRQLVVGARLVATTFVEGTKNLTPRKAA